MPATNVDFNKIYIGCDHGGLPLKDHLLKTFPDLPWQDMGVTSEESVDYPDFADKVCQALCNSDDVGVLICGSGQGMAMRANRFPHIRAALCWSEEVTQLAREHNNANVLCMGARVIPQELAEKMLRVFLQTEFAGGRHQRRVDKLKGSSECPS